MIFLDGDDTKVVYFGPPRRDGTPGRCWHLSGVNAGAEGVILGDNPEGFEFGPFDLLVSEGAKQDGATFLRSVRHKREFDITVHIWGATARDFSRTHNQWFNDWEPDRPGHLGFFSQAFGWQFARVHLDAAPKPTLGVDPTDVKQFGYGETYVMSFTAMDPAYVSFDEPIEWKNTLGLNEANLFCRNPGNLRGYPRCTMNGPGRWWIEDPLYAEDDIRLIATPKLLANETLRIDTHPRRPTARLYSPATGINGRNVWAQLKGRRWLFPIEPRESKEIVVRVEEGSTESSFIMQLTPRSTRPY